MNLRYKEAKTFANGTSESVKSVMTAGDGLGTGGEHLGHSVGALGHVLSDTATGNPAQSNTTVR